MRTFLRLQNRRCKPDKERHVLKPAQAVKMIEALDLRKRVIASLATWEEMRPREVLALQVGDCVPQAVWVQRRVYKGDIDLPKPSGQSGRWLSATAPSRCSINGRISSRIVRRMHGYFLPKPEPPRSDATMSGGGTCTRSSKRSVCNGQHFW